MASGLQDNNWDRAADPYRRSEWLVLAGRLVSRCKRRSSQRQFSTPKPLLFSPSNSSVNLPRLSGARYRYVTSQEILQCRESSSGSIDLWRGTLTTRLHTRPNLSGTYEGSKTEEDRNYTRIRNTAKIHFAHEEIQLLIKITGK